MTTHLLKMTPLEALREGETTIGGSAFLKRSSRRWLGFPRGSEPSSPTDAVRKELQCGWPEGGAMLSNIAADVTAQIPASRKLKIESGHVTGFDPHIPTLFNGSPFAFRQWGKRPKQQIVRIGVNVAASGDHGADELVWSGAVGMVLADLYTQAGYSVEIWALRMISAPEGGALLQVVPLKESHEALLPDLLASTLVSPRFYRVGLIPSNGPLHMVVGEGMPATATSETIAELAPDLAPMVCLPRVFSKDDAIAQINSTIDRLSGRE